MQHADGKQMVSWIRKRISHVGYFMEYYAVVMTRYFERIENVIAVFIVDASFMCDWRCRMVTH